MTPGAWLLFSWIMVGAAALVAHVVLVWQVVAAPRTAATDSASDSPADLGGWRWWALVPLATPFLAFKVGRRWSVAVWAGLLATYVVLRSLEG